MKNLNKLTLVVAVLFLFGCGLLPGQSTPNEDQMPSDQVSSNGELLPAEEEQLTSAEEQLPAEEEQLTSDVEQFGESPAPDKFTLVQLKRSDATLDSILKAEVQKAKEQGRHPYVEFYADWCPPCIALRKSLSDERMVNAFSGTYIIQLDLDEWENELPEAGFDVPGIPIFFELDQDGNPTGRTISGGAWGEDIPENMAPPLKEFFQSVEGTTDGEA